MAGLKNALIKLDSPRSIYYPGQIIKGSLEIEIESPLTLSVVYVNFLGEATVKWTERESQEVNGQKRYKNVEYIGTEEYFKLSQLLAGSYGKGRLRQGSVLNFNPGKYSYPFTFNLPRGIPSSFAGDRGSVEYIVTGRIEYEGQSLFKEDITKSFEVVAPFDLNKGNACVKEPIEIELEEVYGCGCFCSSEPILVRARIPVAAYCPGQAIPVAMTVENRSSVEISNLIFELLTRERYRTQRPVAEYVPKEKILTTVKKGSIMSGNTRNFTVELIVPDMIVPNLEDCSIIDVGYFFRITIKLSGCGDDLQDEAEICLGLIPLHETLDGPYIHPMSHSLPIDPIPEPQSVHMNQITDNMNPMNNMNSMQGAQVPDGTSYFVQVSHEVISSDPSQNFQMGFKASYPPGSEVPPAFNQEFTQFNSQWTPNSMQMNLLGPQNNNLGSNNSFVPRSKSPVPSAPPM